MFTKSSSLERYNDFACTYVPYSGSLLQEEMFVNLAILLSEEIFATLEFNYYLCI